MSGILPTRSEKSVDRDGDASVLYLDDEEASSVLSTLSSETTLSVFCSLTEETLTASELADRLDLSVQNVSYHLEKLQEAGLIETIDVCYSTKGREMDVYAVASEPTVLVLATGSERPRVRRAFEQLTGVIGPPALLIAGWKTVEGVLEPFTAN